MASVGRSGGSPVSVFARVRPLTALEVAAGAGEFTGLSLTSSDEAEPAAVAYDTGRSTIGGFTGVLGQEALNGDVFHRCVAPRLQTVLQGGCASLFCYGYTGSGKTHTVIGYGKERGLYFLSAECLLGELRQVSGSSDLFLRATACEMYNDEVFDLLGPTKLPCSLRVDEVGRLQVLGSTTSMPLDESEGESLQGIVSAELLPKGMHATLVTRARGLRSALVRSAEDLQQIGRSCVEQRAAGTSTEHAQSSRSHALLRLEVLSAEMLQATEELEASRAVVPALQNGLDNISTVRFKVLFDGNQRVLHLPGAAGESGLVTSLENTYPVVEGEAKSDSFKLVGYETEGAKTLSEWAARFGHPSLILGYRFTRREFDTPGKWEEIETALTKKASELQKQLANARSRVNAALQALEQVQMRGPACLGGSLVLVDLAGADYDHRGGHQQKESAAINKSLLALKECLRSIAKVSSVKPRFRDSKLTRLLEDSLVPSISSSRRNSKSESVMLVNVSPAEHLGKMTLNTLRYGQLFAAAGSSEKPKAASKAKLGAATAVGRVERAPARVGQAKC